LRGQGDLGVFTHMYKMTTSAYQDGFITNIKS